MSTPTQAQMSVMFNGDQLEVSAILSDSESIDRLIRALEANKPLLPKKPKNEESASCVPQDKPCPQQ